MSYVQIVKSQPNCDIIIFCDHYSGHSSAIATRLLRRGSEALILVFCSDELLILYKWFIFKEGFVTGCDSLDTLGKYINIVNVNFTVCFKL